LTSFTGTSTGNDERNSLSSTYTIYLAKRQALSFEYSDIPDLTQQLSFAGDIARLDRVWDDEGVNWNTEECRKISSIKGVAVALRYWPDVYRNKKDNRWKGIKATWTEWKVSDSHVSFAMLIANSCHGSMLLNDIVSVHPTCSGQNFRLRTVSTSHGREYAHV
jgi:hypothetical protein